MNTALVTLSIAILLVAAYVVVMNACSVIISIRNKRRGIDRRHSTVPALSLVLTAVALLVYPRPHKAWMLVVPLLDVANWNLLLFPVLFPLMLLRESRRKKRTVREHS